MVIDTHAHIAHQDFIKDVKARKCGQALSIEPGKKWELLVTRSNVLGRQRVHRNPCPAGSMMSNPA